MKVVAHVFGIAMVLLSTGAQAQTVWRCGPEGRSYSQQPCTEGRVVAAADGRAADDLAQARQVAQREQALADSLRQERLLREAPLPPGTGLTSLGPTTAKPVHAHVKGHHRPDKAAEGNASKTGQKSKQPDGKTPSNSFTALAARPD